MCADGQLCPLKAAMNPGGVYRAAPIRLGDPGLAGKRVLHRCGSQPAPDDFLCPCCGASGWCGCSRRGWWREVFDPGALRRAIVSINEIFSFIWGFSLPSAIAGWRDIQQSLWGVPHDLVFHPAPPGAR